MKTNRLHLDFSLLYADERNQFITEYLNDPIFITNPPTQQELYEMGSYILWGQDHDKPQKKKEIQDTYGLHSQWSSNVKEVSYDELLESEIFNENIFAIQRPPLKITRMKFIRNDVHNAPESIKEAYNILWHQIDSIRVIIEWYEYDISHRRIKPPSNDLLMRFNPDEQRILHERALNISQHVYLKYRKELRELYTDQYVLKDSYVQEMPHASTINDEGYYTAYILGDNIDILPLGLYRRGFNADYLWSYNINPYDIPYNTLEWFSHLLWEPRRAPLYIDFTDPTHIDALIKYYDDLTDRALTCTVEDAIPALINTFDYYARAAMLSDINYDILQARIEHKTNDQIARDINSKYNKHFRENYISTLYHKGVLNKIANAARLHRNRIELSFFPEEFKKCNTCGRWFPRTEDYFTHRSRSRDGFHCHCKECEKEIRHG